MVEFLSDSAETNLWIAVFCLISKTSKIDGVISRNSIFTVTDGPGDILLLLVNPLGVDTMASSIIAL